MHCTMHKFNRMASKLVLIILFNVIVAEIVAIHRCSESEVVCICGEHPDLEVKYFEVQPEFTHNGSKNCVQLSSEVCASHSCQASLADASNAEVDTDKYSSFRDNSFYRAKVSFPPLDDARESHRISRNRRSAKKCLPPQIEHAAMECYLWPEFTSCDIKCSRGYGFVENGEMVLKTKRVCRQSKPVWSPKKTFPVCKPYINCKAILVKPGKLSCHPGPEVPYCNISCQKDYENGFGEVAMERYECIDDHFAEKLPHCATIDQTVDMLKLSENRQVTVAKNG